MQTPTPSRDLQDTAEAAPGAAHDLILTHAAVESLVRRCLFGEGRPENCDLVVQGIIRGYGFDRDRIVSATPEIERLIGELPDNFLRSEGGGWSFLNLCVDRHGHHWAEHPTMEELCCLAIAANRAAWLMPREMWSILPGGMPYVVFWTGEPAKSEAA